MRFFLVITTLALWLVDNFQDQQANAELAKIMGEFTESGDQSPSASSKGDDLLAMMDGLWHGHPDSNAPGKWGINASSAVCSTVDQSAVWTCKHTAATSHAARKNNFFGCFWDANVRRCFTGFSNDKEQICIVNK